MKTVKELRELIKNNSLTDFKLQEFVKYFAQNIEKMTYAEEAGYIEYLKKGASQLGYEVRDLKAVYESYKKEI